MGTLSAASQLHMIVGDDLMTQICDTFGGQTIYIPRRPPDFARDHRVCLEFNSVIHESASVGSAYAQVGVMEDISPRTVRRIVRGN